MEDLSLILMEDLIEEIQKRKEAMVLAWVDHEDGMKKIHVEWSGDFITRCGLATVLNFDIINDPNIHNKNRDENEKDD